MVKDLNTAKMRGIARKFPSPIGVIFSLIDYKIVDDIVTSSSNVSVSYRSYILSYTDTNIVYLDISEFPSPIGVIFSLIRRC